MASWAESISAFEDAALWFGQVVPAADGRWEEAGLGDWTVRDLVGHTSRALLTVESYLGSEERCVEVETATDYFHLALASIGDPQAVTERARAAGAALGKDPSQSVAKITERVLARVRSTGEDDPVSTPVGVMRLRDYLPTRTFELTVHTSDLVVALGSSDAVPATAAAESLRLVTDLVVRSGQSLPVVRAVTGREGLPAGFTVL
ncbi:MAG: maleylpyruvate isomerase N-terminal domain-containing protein [Ornithinimicrobium sp.]